MPKTNSITQERLKELLSYDPETGDFRWRKLSKYAPTKHMVGDIAGWKNGSGYIIIRLDKIRYKAHRLAFLYMNEPLPEEVDHINGNGLDNRWSNLRPANKTINQRNRAISIKNTSGVQGVCFEIHKGKPKWAARINYNGKQHRLGRFDDWFDAVCARKTAETKHGYLSRG